MKVVQNTPDLLILRHRPVPLIIFGAGLTCFFVGVTIFALFNAAPFPALVLIFITGVMIFALHKQQVMVGVYADKSHDTIAVYTQRFLSRQNTIYALSKVQGFDLQYSGLEERIALRLKGTPDAHPLTQDFHRHNSMTQTAAQANAWIIAAR